MVENFSVELRRRDDDLRGMIADGVERRSALNASIKEWREERETIARLLNARTPRRRAPKASA